MLAFFSFISSLLEPSESKCPDPEKRRLHRVKNMHIFCLLLGQVLLFTLLLPLTTLRLEVLFYRIILLMFQTILFLILCRSYLWIFYVEFFVMVILLNQSILMSQMKDSFFFNFGYHFIMPALLIFVTQSKLIIVVISCIQLYVFQTNYKPMLIHNLEELGPAEFTDKLLEASILPFIVILIGSIFGFSLLKNQAEELAKAKKIAEDALEKQKTFILSFSHELRNPLNSLLGNLQLVLMGAISQENREMIKTAKICGELLLQYINNLLDTGKFGIGNLEVTPASTNTRELFERIWAISHEIIKRKGLADNIRIERTVPSQLMLDSQRVTQILLNLVGNAVKFTESGSITTTVQWVDYQSVCEECFEPIPYDEMGEGLFEKEENISIVNLNKQQNIFSSNYLSLNKKNNKFNMDEAVPIQDIKQGILKIIVKDTGCGMKEEALKRLFQKFSQVSEDSAKRQIGTGLGLFITKELCKKMQGDIKVYSREKIGTTFIVCIPTQNVRLTQLSSNYSLETISRALLGKNKKAIIADSSSFNINLLSSYLSKIGIHVIGTATNGEDAFKKYIKSLEKRIGIDIIILDVDMPKFDGKLVCEKIRKYEEDHHKRSKVNIVMTSGNYDELKLKEYLYNSKKANSFLRKPLIFEEFLVTIYDLLIKE